MENFLKSCGLEKAINTFTENKVQLDQVERLTENEIKELLPNVGDRVRFRDAVEIKTSNKRSTNAGEKNSNFPSKKMKMTSRREDRKAHIVKILRTDKTKKQKLVDAADSMFKEYSNDWLEERRNVNPDWQMIDFENGVINCPFCQTTITPQIRNTRKFYWNYTNIGRHLELVHPTGGADDVDVNSVLEITLDETENYDDHAALTTSAASVGSSMRKLKVSLHRIEPTMYNNQRTTFHQSRPSPSSNDIQSENSMETEPSDEKDELLQQSNEILVAAPETKNLIPQDSLPNVDVQVPLAEPSSVSEFHHGTDSTFHQSRSSNEIQSENDVMDIVPPNCASKSLIFQCRDETDDDTRDIIAMEGDKTRTETKNDCANEHETDDNTRDILAIEGGKATTRTIVRLEVPCLGKKNQLLEQSNENFVGALGTKFAVSTLFRNADDSMPGNHSATEISSSSESIINSILQDSLPNVQVPLLNVDVQVPLAEPFSVSDFHHDTDSTFHQSRSSNEIQSENDVMDIVPPNCASKSLIFQCRDETDDDTRDIIAMEGDKTRTETKNDCANEHDTDDNTRDILAIEGGKATTRTIVRLELPCLGKKNQLLEQSNENFVGALGTKFAVSTLFRNADDSMSGNHSATEISSSSESIINSILQDSLPNVQVPLLNVDVQVPLAEPSSVSDFHHDTDSTFHQSRSSNEIQSENDVMDIVPPNCASKSLIFQCRDETDDDTRDIIAMEGDKTRTETKNDCANEHETDDNTRDILAIEGGKATTRTIVRLEVPCLGKKNQLLEQSNENFVGALGTKFAVSTLFRNADDSMPGNHSATEISSSSESIINSILQDSLPNVQVPLLNVDVQVPLAEPFSVSDFHHDTPNCAGKSSIFKCRDQTDDGKRDILAMEGDKTRAKTENDSDTSEQGPTSYSDGKIKLLQQSNDNFVPISIPEWKEDGVKFVWAKASRRDKYVPCFMMNNGECKWITTKGGLSSKSFVAHEFHENIDIELKKGKMKDLRKFNKDNNTSFA